MVVCGKLCWPGEELGKLICCWENAGELVVEARVDDSGVKPRALLVVSAGED